VLSGNPVTGFAFALLLGLVACAALGPSLVPYDPLASDEAEEQREGEARDRVAGDDGAGMRQRRRDAAAGPGGAEVQGFVLAMALLYTVLNLTIDLAYGLIDPRVRGAVGEIDREVQDRVEQRHRQDEALDRGEVGGDQRLDRTSSAPPGPPACRGGGSSSPTRSATPCCRW
jgi:hypothetical protein